MNYEFIYDKPQGLIGSYLVEAAASIADAVASVRQSRPDIVDTLLEIISGDNESYPSLNGV